MGECASYAEKVRWFQCAYGGPYRVKEKHPDVTRFPHNGSNLARYYTTALPNLTVRVVTSRSGATLDAAPAKCPWVSSIFNHDFPTSRSAGVPLLRVTPYLDRPRTANCAHAKPANISRAWS